MHRIHQRLRYILNHDSAEIIELGFGLALLLWGLWVANPTVTTFDSSRTYSVLLSVVPFGWDAEIFWGILIASVGGNQLAGVLLSDNTRYREVATGAAAVVLSWMGLAFQLGNPVGPSLIWFGVFALMEAWALTRIGATKPPRYNKY